jgi:cysteine desulfurase family protein (TIGR01976 family)
MSASSTSRTHSALDVEWVRAQFPSLRLTVNGHPAAFLDAPAGTQVPKQVADAIYEYLLHENANTAGSFLTSRKTDAMLAAAHQAMADFLGCERDEVYFGQNMTTLTFALARSIGRELNPGDEIVVTTLDHDANVAPWRALEERGIVVRQVDVNAPDCTLDMDDLRGKITGHTKLVAVGYAANAVGTINHVAEAVRLARAVGAYSFIDAVHYAPHGLIDVRALGCDFLACSTYKFFGPHMGVMYGKREHLERLRPYKVRPAPDYLPDRWETGTLCHEGIAGVSAAVDYIAGVGRRAVPNLPESAGAARREAILAAYRVIREYESGLIRRLIAGLVEIPGVTIYGITDPARFDWRVPTVGMRMDRAKPPKIAAYLGDRGIFTWDGNYYAVNLTERLGVESDGGLLRIGLVHYNTAEEVERLLAALRELATR